MKELRKFEMVIGSGLFSGYVKFAPGTVGSSIALLIYLIPGFEYTLVILPLIILSLLGGVFISGRFEEVYGKDPSQCTIDEFVGTWISLIWLPKSLLIMGIAFLIWRLLDVIKPFPASNAERLKGGWGIMLDDVISGIYTRLIMVIVLKFI